MLAPLLICLSVCQVSPQNHTNAVVQAMMDKLKSVRTVEMTLSGEYGYPGKLHPYHALVKASRESDRYWAKFEGEEFNTEYASYDDGILTYTGDDGRRASRKLPAPNVSMNFASAIGPQARDVLLNLSRFQEDGSKNTFFVQSEEVQGHMCDVVGNSRSSSDGGEQITTIRYLWIDQSTHLPRAFQKHSFIRGTSELGPKQVILSLVLDPHWQKSPFGDVPASVSQRISVALYVEPTPSFRIGDLCPNIEVETFDSKSAEFTPVNLASLIKSKTLITFWASWCRHCIDEIHALETIPEIKLGKIRVIAVGVFDSKQNCRQFIAREQLSSTLVLDPGSESRSSKLTGLFGIEGIPHAFLFDSNKRLIRHWVGFQDKDELLKKLAD